MEGSSPSLRTETSVFPCIPHLSASSPGLLLKFPCHESGRWPSQAGLRQTVLWFAQPNGDPGLSGPVYSPIIYWLCGAMTMIKMRTDKTPAQL